MRCEPFLITEQSPFRRLDWGWRTARLLARAPFGYRRRPKAKWHYESSKFLRARRYYRTREDRRTLAGRHPAIRGAARIQVVPALRHQVQARVLAGQTDEEIAAKYSLDPTAVSAFEELFFCVRDRLEARDWIVSTVFWPEVIVGFRPEETGPLLRYLGYFGGATLLEAVLQLFWESVDGIVAGFEPPERFSWEPVPTRLPAKLSDALTSLLFSLRRIEDSATLVKTMPAFLAQLAHLQSVRSSGSFSSPLQQLDLTQLFAVEPTNETLAEQTVETISTEAEAHQSEYAA